MISEREEFAERETVSARETVSVRAKFRAAGFLVLTALAGLVGCGELEFDPPSRQEQVQDAEALYSLALFDSLSWESNSVRDLEGNNHYAAKCRNCHGVLGDGATDYARQRNLDVPSLVEPDWEFGDDLEGTRRRVFVGHADGMPIWGVAGISLREIDAVSYYVLEVLRPEVLGGI